MNKVTTPAALNAFNKVQADSHHDLTLLVAFAEIVNKEGLFEMITENTTIEGAISDCDASISFYQPGGEYVHGSNDTDEDAERILLVAEAMRISIHHLFWGYRIGLFN